jgi:hypothetical protein
MHEILHGLAKVRSRLLEAPVSFVRKAAVTPVAAGAATPVAVAPVAVAAITIGAIPTVTASRYWRVRLSSESAATTGTSRAGGLARKRSGAQTDDGRTEVDVWEVRGRLEGCG